MFFLFILFFIFGFYLTIQLYANTNRDEKYLIERLEHVISKTTTTKSKWTIFSIYIYNPCKNQLKTRKNKMEKKKKSQVKSIELENNVLFAFIFNQM